MEFLKSFGHFFVDIIETVVVSAAIFVILYLFVMQPHRVEGESMYPTFHTKDFIFTEKVTYRFNEPKRGDIVVFKPPGDKYQGKELIKRIIALPGEKIKVEAGQVTIYNQDNPNGRVLQEDYLKPSVRTDTQAFLREGEVKELGADQYIVMGDNRGNSSDSRYFGPITKEEIVGRAFVRLLPLNKMSLINGASFKAAE